MYTLLMSPGKVSFITNPIMDKGSASEWSCTLQAYGIQDESPLHNLDYKVNHEKNGFLHMVRFQEEILGIIHVENLALPAFLTDYLNASMFIVSVFALALHNASIFRILKQTISDLDSEIASRRQAQESLQVSNKKLNLLSSITRHDLNNHLAVQIGYLELLDRSEFNQTDARYLDNIKKSTEKMASMIRFTKDYQEIGVRSPQWHKVCQVVNEAVTKLNLEGKQFMNDLSPDLEVYSDPMIVKVFYNLIDNSLRYAGKSTYIRFYSQFENDQLQIICEDDGHGIEDDQKINIFNRGVGKNTGLGLFLSKEILDITGLAICENGRFGEGARFKITVPSSAFRICGNNHSILQ
jgi:signal transduction histidine kinase